MLEKCLRCLVSTVTLAVLAVFPFSARTLAQSNSDGSSTTTPIKHIIVIFDENISFDHYFGTYPYAANLAGEHPFYAQAGTPRVNNLLGGGLLDQNLNSTQPFRLTPAEAVTCDQNHGYSAEQSAFDHGLMDQFPQSTGSGGPGCYDAGKGPGIVMAYFDGNTVTAIWNYAQHFALSDNSYSTNFGPSTVGAINLISGNTCCATMLPLDADGKTPGSPSGNIAGAQTYGAVVGDPRPGYDKCLTTPVLGTASDTLVTMSGKNIGDLLNAKSITWGWFQGGFATTGVNSDGTPACGAVSTGLASPTGYNDYIPHHEPFQYYQSTANPNHLAPSSLAEVGHSDQANHQYDLKYFWTALQQGNLPSVTFLKAKGPQDGHPGYSDPIDEQTWLVSVVNAVSNSPSWKDTAIVLLYDDSDGWYDHAMDPVVNQSDVSDDNLTAPGACGVTAVGGTTGRCGYGPRQPLLVISPYAKHNYVDHRITDQSSVLRFIEDNWSLGRIGNGSLDEKAGKLDGFFDWNAAPNPKIILNPTSGEIVSQGN